MKRSIIATTLVLCVGCATGVAVRDLVVPARAQGQTGPSYEYDLVNTDTFSAQKRKQVLVRYGREGWRLAGVAYSGVELIFERPAGTAPLAP